MAHDKRCTLPIVLVTWFISRVLRTYSGGVSGALITIMHKRVERTG